jgi:hypothetical protein
MQDYDLEPGENLCDDMDWVTDEMFETIKKENKFWTAEVEDAGFDFEKNKHKLITNLDMLQSMSVEEATLYKKWEEWNKDLHNSMKRLPILQSYYDNIWRPTDLQNKDLTIQELQALEPYVEITDDATKWTDIRKLISTMEFNSNPGRNVKAFIKDRITGKLLGVISLGSDVVSVKVRDEYIGWTKEDKFVDKKISCIAMGTSIVATQPLGFNMLGGKLMSALTTSPTFRQEWKQKYGDTLCGIHTTSLYGVHSQYNGIPHFKTLGESAGKVGIKPDDGIYKVWHHYIKEKYNEWYKVAILGTGPKQIVLSKVFKEIGIKMNDYYHGYKRGVFLALFHENGKEYLCGKIKEENLKLRDKIANGDDYTIKWWKDKAVKRYSTLHAEGRLKDETLYYIDIIGMTWEQCKEKYLKEVGR